MFVLNLNKTGLRTMLVLQFLCWLRYPACGRPLFGEDDAAVDEDPEEDEDLVDDQDMPQDEYEQDGQDIPKRCRGLTGQELQTCMDKWRAEIDAWSKNVNAGTPASASSKDE